MNGFTFAHLSDLHLPFEPHLTWPQQVSKRQLSAWSWRKRGGQQSRAVLDALVDDLRAHPVAQIVVTGDITNFSLPQEFRQAADWLTALAPADRISLVPGNHDALVPLVDGAGLGQWEPWTRTQGRWPFVHRFGEVALIGLNSAVPTAPLLAQGRLGAEQLARLEQVLGEEGAAGRTRIVVLHHPPSDGAVQWRKALTDRAELQAVLRRVGAELVLFGHARDARLDTVRGPSEPIPCLSVPSSSALPNPHDEGARWHRVSLLEGGRIAAIEIRRWSTAARRFESDRRYRLELPRAVAPGPRSMLRTRPTGTDRPSLD